MNAHTDLFNDVLDQVIADGLVGRDAMAPFLRLSAVLVGRREMEAWLGRAYLKTLAGFATPAGAKAPNSPAYSSGDVREVLTRFVDLEHRFGRDPAALGEHVRKELLLSSDPGITNVTRSIASLWYCAGIIEFESGLGFLSVTAPIETYSSALAWQAVGGNPMGIPGPYYGGWAYPSPTLIVPPAPAAAESKPAKSAAQS